MTHTRAKPGICNPETLSFTSLPSSPSPDGEIKLYVMPEQCYEAGPTLILPCIYVASLFQDTKVFYKYLAHFPQLLFDMVVKKHHCSQTEAKGNRTFEKSGSSERQSRTEILHQTHSQDKPCTSQDSNKIQLVEGQHKIDFFKKKKKE